jgi:cyclic-di-GMP-binding protein
VVKLPTDFKKTKGVRTMPSFDVTSDIDWQELDNAINQTQKELSTRFDFKGIQFEMEMDKKEKVIKLWTTEAGKLDALNDTLQTRLVRRGISLLALDYGDVEPATGKSVRQVIKVQAGIEKEIGKKIIAKIKEGKFKVQAQIQDEQVRVTAKKRDELQTVISFLKENQNDIKISMQFGNFRD